MVSCHIVRNCLVAIPKTFNVELDSFQSPVPMNCTNQWPHSVNVLLSKQEISKSDITDDLVVTDYIN